MMNFGLVVLIGALVGAFYAGVVLQIVLIRARHRMERRHQQRVEDRWLPLLTAGRDEDPGTIPVLPRGDIVPFLVLWNLLHETFSGDIKARLNDVAREAGVPDLTLRMLRARSLRRRLLAVATLGQLRETRGWDALAALTAHRESVLGLASAGALMRIDPERALPVILPQVANRPDWSRNHVFDILSEVGVDLVSRPLTETALQVPPEQAHRLVQYFDLAHIADAIPAVRTILGRTSDPECIAACLRVFADVDSLDTVRVYLHHPSWLVRVQAVQVIGRLGSAGDYPLLVPLLSDREWWVRYRAAKAIFALPGVAQAQVSALSRELPDPYARDIMAHVLAEAA